MVKEKTGRAMQEKERERKGKNGKIIIKHMKFFYKGASYQFKSSRIKPATPEERQMELPF